MAAFTLCRTFFLLLIALLATTSALPLISGAPSHTLESLPDTRQVDCTGESCISTVNVDRTSNDNSNSTSEEKMVSLQGACLSLKQLLAQDFGDVNNLGMHTSLFPFFVYPEIYLNLEDLKKEDSVTDEQKHLDNCQTFQRDLTRAAGDNSICSWSYTCAYNADEFPAYQIQTTDCGIKKGLPAVIMNRVECKQLNQQVHFAKKENGCWKSSDKTVKIGCKCVEKNLL